jgi:hypothetical protein
VHCKEYKDGLVVEMRELRSNKEVKGLIPTLAEKQTILTLAI